MLATIELEKARAYELLPTLLSFIRVVFIDQKLLAQHKFHLLISSHNQLIYKINLING